MTSEVKFDLRFEISDLKNPYSRGFIVHSLVNLGTCQEQQEEISLFLSCASAAANKSVHCIAEARGRPCVTSAQAQTELGAVSRMSKSTLCGDADVWKEGKWTGGDARMTYIKHHVVTGWWIARCNF